MLEDYDIKIPKLVMFKIAEMIDVKVTIDCSNIIADLTKSSDQSSGGMNCSYSAASSAVQYAIKAITDPENVIAPIASPNDISITDAV